MSSHFKGKFPEKKPEMSDDQGGLTVCNIDWKKVPDICQFCKSYYICTSEQKQNCKARPAESLCQKFKPIHPSKGGCMYSPYFLAEQIMRKARADLQKAQAKLSKAAGGA